MQLAITADDFGVDRAINEAIIRLARNKHISSVSVMLHARADLDGIRELAATDVAIGVHLVFVEEAALALPPGAGGIIDSAGNFPKSWTRLLPQVFMRPSVTQLLRAEAEAQLSRFAQLGIPLRFINSHQHVHMFPPIWQALVPVFEQQPGAIIRSAARTGGLGKQAMLGLSGMVSIHQARPKNRMVFACGIESAGRFDARAADRVMSSIKRMIALGRVPELVVHPGQEPLYRPDRYAHWRYQWGAEASFIASCQFSELLREQGFEIGFPS